MDMTTRKHNLLTASELDAFARELDRIRDNVRADLGDRDATYIRNMVSLQKRTELAGRLLIHASRTPIGWGAGVASLTISKILENMEIGHNVMHGQYDWMNDPELQSQTYEWDTACDGDSWRRTHNYEHHTFTNIIGKDRDYGYAVLRLSEDAPWRPTHLFQTGNFVVLCVLFQWGVALHELEIEKLRKGTVSWQEKRPLMKRMLRKGARQIGKDYLLFPALAGPGALKVILGNGAANLGRNLWASTIIFCGHFTEGSETFSQADCDNETRGQWYYRQLLGSGNFTGPRWLHVLSGHLSYQIEHHLFPDIPAHRYPEMAHDVQAVCERYNIPYNTGPFWQQYKSVVKRVLRCSLPPEGHPWRRMIPFLRSVE